MGKQTTSDVARREGAEAEYAFRYTAQRACEIEERWQAWWETHGTFRVANPREDGFDASRRKFYCLDMFPYPSGAGLHVGHPEGYTATDIYCRYRRLRGDNVLHPMGWDAFGLPAEQYAIQTGVHPAITTRKAIDNFRRQLKRFGFSYDWSREFATIDPDYYRWTQWIWLKAYDAWYDRGMDRARPIRDLVKALEAGEVLVGPEGEVVEAKARTARARTWASLDDDERRTFIDGTRLAYLGEQMVNWCPKLGTALANEEVIDGRSERGGYPVYRKPLRQWLFRITAFAERLLRDLDGLDWPESTRTMQREWIGRSVGAEIDFPLIGAAPGLAPIRVYTTRPDTLFGATYMVLAPEHPLVAALLAAPAPKTDAAKLRSYVEAARRRLDVDRLAESKEKTGVFTGFEARNPATGRAIPIWVADYVLMGYGHGAIMAVPAHDGRDFDFAKRFGLEVRQVVEPDEGSWDRSAAYAGPGRAVNSSNAEVSLDGLDTDGAKRAIIAWLEERGIGRSRVNYKLRDWLFSRQRYWGEPFPVVFDSRGRHHPVDRSKLPVVLPEMDDYQPIESDEPVPLLAKAQAWVHTTAGAAGVAGSVLAPDEPVTRETNTMPGWAGSCWYYLRYCDPRNDDRFVSREAERYWLGGERAEGTHGGGVDLYIGGAEHAVLHLLYARFWHKILYDLGEVSTSEPFRKLFHQGMITSFAYQRADRSLVAVDQVEEREDGTFAERSTGDVVTQVVAKMSKALKNVVNPDDVIAEYGADTFRLYEMYMGPLDATKPWNPRDIVGVFRFLQRAWRLVVNEATGALVLRESSDAEVERSLHRTIARVGQDLDRLAFNTAIAALIEFVNDANKAGGLTADQLARFAITLSPFAPHLAEELWSRLGRAPSISHEQWPAVDRSLVAEAQIELPVQILGKVRARITVPAGADAATIERLALDHERVRELLEGRAVKKVIVVPGKIVNVIV